jgi:hypothetical protein
MIYFIRSYNQFIKIGCSSEPDSRCKNLQTGSPIKLKVKAILSGDYKTEKGLHELFAHLRHNGEWFRYTDELKWFIRAIQDNPNLNNIKSLYMESQRMRISSKAKRLGKNHKLSKRLAKSISPLTPSGVGYDKLGNEPNGVKPT